MSQGHDIYGDHRWCSPAKISREGKDGCRHRETLLRMTVMPKNREIESVVIEAEPYFLVHLNLT